MNNIKVNPYQSVFLKILLKSGTSFYNTFKKVLERSIEKRNKIE